MEKIKGYPTFEEAMDAAQGQAEKVPQRNRIAWSVIHSTFWAEDPSRPFLAVPLPDLAFEAFGQRTGYIHAKELGRVRTSGEVWDMRGWQDLRLQ